MLSRFVTASQRVTTLRRVRCVSPARRPSALQALSSLTRKPWSIVTLTALIVSGGSLPSSAWAEYHSETVAFPRSYSVSASAAASHLDTEDARVGNADTARLLEREPDLRVRRAGGLNGPAYLSLRGADPNATRFSLDGMPIHGASTTVLDVNTLLPEMLARMDIYRTTLPVELGAPAPGGVVDLRLRDSSRKEAWAVAGYGSWGTRKLSAAGTVPLDDGHFRIAASYRGSRGDFRFYDTNGTDRNPYDDNPNQRRKNNDFQQGSVLLIRDLRLDDWRLRVLSVTDITESGVSGIDIAQAEHARRSRIQQFLAFEAKNRIGQDDRTDLSMVASLAVTQSTYHDRRGEIGLGRQDRSDQQLLGFLALRSATWLPHQFSLHFVYDQQVEYYRPSDRIAQVYIFHATRVLPSFGGELRWESQNERFAIAAGTRYHHYLQTNRAKDVPAAPPEKVNTPALSPQVGVTGSLVKNDRVQLDVFSYLSRTHRQPGFDELFGDNGGSVGNPALKMERQTAFEAGGRVRWQARHVEAVLRVSAWKHWRQDAIEYVAQPIGVRKPFNVEGAEVVGQDLSLGLRSQYAAFTIRGAHLASKNLSADRQQHGKHLPWRSPWTASADLRLTPIPWQSLRTLTFQANARYDDPFFADLRNNRQYPDRLEFDLAVSWKLPFPQGPVLRAEAHNIANRRMTTLPGRDGGQDVRIQRSIADYAGYPRPGRGFFVSLSWALE